MSDETRKLAREAVAREMASQGMGNGELADRAAVDRKTVNSFLGGKRWPQRPNRTAISAALGWPPDWIDHIEHTGNDDPPEPAAPSGVADLDLVEFQVAGNFGVRVVVKGPVRDRVELEESVMRLIARMQSDQAPNGSTS